MRSTTTYIALKAYTRIARAAAAILIPLSLASAGAPALADQAPATTTCPGYTVCPALDPTNLLNSADAKSVVSGVVAAEAGTLSKLSKFPSLTDKQKPIALGAAILFDSNLSVNQNQSCDLCHTRPSGFTGGITVVNRATGAYFGSQGSPHFDGTPTSGARAGVRRPISYAYSVFAPTLALVNNDLVGGMFWDMRATGFVTGEPAIDQAMDPYVNPLELGFADPACVVRAVSREKYAVHFASFWGATAFSFTWPADGDQLCAVPNITNAPNPEVVALSPADRAQVSATYRNIAASLVALERSDAVSPFSSKYDKVLCGTASLNASEARGLNLFLGSGHCAACHTAVAPNPPTTCGAHPLLTNFASSNIGVPQNPHIPYLTENAADGLGYVANPAGPAFIDDGVGDMLRALDQNQPNNPVATADPNLFDGKFQVPSLRNVTKMPHAGFLRVYGHNGEFESTAEAVHFHVTRDALGVCPSSDPHQKDMGVTCWPQPEQPKNLETTLVGNLPLTPSDEADIVNFLADLNDLSFGSVP